MLQITPYMDENRKLVSYVTEAIKLERKRQGMTQAEIAEIAGINPGVYRHTEVHRRELKLSEYLRIRSLLKIPDESTLLNGFLQVNTDVPPLKKLKEQKVIAVTSFKGGVGVSTLSILFCNEVAKNYKVLLIDAGGMQTSCVWQRESDILQNTDIDPMYEIMPVEIENIQRTIKRLKNEYDFIVIDFPKVFYIGDVFEFCDYVFCLFQLQSDSATFEGWEAVTNYINGPIEKLFEKVGKASITNPDLSCVMIPFGFDVSIDFRDSISATNTYVAPEPFKYNSSIQSNISTLHPFSLHEKCNHIPYMIDTLRMLHHLMVQVGADIEFK